MLCIYCGKAKAETDDHVPPKCLFPKPMPNNMITVPACYDCNNNYGKDDEHIRNILASLEIHEQHPEVKNYIAPKRDSSFTKKFGVKKLKTLLNKMKLVDRFDDSGNYLGKQAAISLDDPIFDKFIERVSRGLLYHKNDMGYFEGNFKWKLSPTQQDIKKMSKQMVEFLLSGEPNNIGDTFTYVGYYIPEYVGSMWFLNFYNGIEIMSIVTPNRN